MAIAIGQPGVLKDILSKLHEQGFNQINSLEEIEEFLNSYESKKSEIVDITANKIDQELNSLKKEIDNHRIILNDNYRIKKDDLLNRIEDLFVREDRLYNQVFKTKFASFIRRVRLFIVRFRMSFLKKYSIKKIHRSTKGLNKKVFLLQVEYNNISKNKSRVIDRRIASKIKDLDKLKTFLDSESSLISGAIGELLVSNELEKLSDDFIIINDFKTHFDPPIYIKKTDDRIMSVQIDHVVLSKAGIFLIETKNWSKKSVESIDLRSPVEQIVRNGRAVYVAIQKAIGKNNVYLEKHHWGQKKIPIRNLIVMINNKPPGEFQFVKIKLLRELNGYLKYFDHVISNEELENIKNFFLELQ
jgi:hypothetical protein